MCGFWLDECVWKVSMRRSVPLELFDVEIRDLDYLFRCGGFVLLEVFDWGCVVVVPFMFLEGFDAEVCAFGGFLCGDQMS